MSVTPDTAREILRQLAADAMAGCGQVYEAYSQHLDRKIDRKAATMTPADASILLDIAREEYEYLPDGGNEIELDGTVCWHGLKADTCPCGCFED